ncbi:hypothetical protein L9F63_017376, partial [Diploptera punctata]
MWNSLHSSPLPNLEEKAVIITGCDTGFGNKLARQLDEKGVTVFACCLYGEGKNALKLRNECSNNLHIIQLDVTRDDEGFDPDTFRMKELLAVVNNAGIFLACEATITSNETYRRMLDVNTLGTVRVTKAFLPMLSESKGRIVVVESLAGITAVPFMTAYSMSKHALAAYTESLRREIFKFSVTLHTINPVAYDTRIADPDTISYNTYKEWNQASEDIKNLYGTEYLSKME